ncbi:hypothetical protein AY600_09030 [Phormidium willei BDU 130791]|nr:hypothetical protein AY600_09030 [Phormidium willei BDU 130791]
MIRERCSDKNGLVGGLVGEDIHTKTMDNQGIYNRLINSLIFSIVFMPFGILIPTALHYFDRQMQLSQILALGAVMGFLMGAITSGLGSAIQHLAPRITLWLFGYAPWNYSKFLRYCTDRGFLQRVGGGYRFVHALLRDHFAENIVS